MEEPMRSFEEDLAVEDSPESGARLHSGRHQSSGGGRAARTTKETAKEIARMELPEGYRLLVTAPRVWVLVDVYSVDQVVARYRGELVADRVHQDIQKHSTARTMDTRHRSEKRAGRRGVGRNTGRGTTEAA